MKDKKVIFRIAVWIFLLDQIIKVFIQRNMHLNDQITIIPNFFSLYYVKNTGAAFSILEDNTIILIIISVIFICILNHFIKQEKELTKISIISFGMILGGIYGNLIDRIIYHAVIDFLSFQFFSYSFPIFNVADIAITVGVGLLIINTLFDKEKIKEGVKHD